jgi:hypothetical protein
MKWWCGTGSLPLKIKHDPDIILERDVCMLLHDGGLQPPNFILQVQWISKERLTTTLKAQGTNMPLLGTVWSPKGK